MILRRFSYALGELWPERGIVSLRDTICGEICFTLSEDLILFDMIKWLGAFLSASIRGAIKGLGS
ncbi:hypothetical protein RV134_390014 [Roseovarius sp. EC-HK134]|nr:hypothetical protein RV134_390014 [Roseovarius sp. EC-HK134]